MGVAWVEYNLSYSTLTVTHQQHPLVLSDVRSYKEISVECGQIIIKQSYLCKKNTPVFRIKQFHEVG